MDRTYEAGASASPPSPPASPSSGYPTDGNPSTGQAATQPGAWWFHMLTEELYNIITAAGLTPDHTVTNQLLAALQAGFGLANSKATSGYVTLPGGIIIQWGQGGGIDHATVVLPVAFPSSTLCVLATEGTSSSGGIGGIAKVGLESDTMTNTSFNIRTDASVSTTFYWIAVGY